MKKLVSYMLLAVVPILFSFKMGDVEEIKSALAEGNSNKISAYFSSSVQMSLPNSNGVYSKPQAKVILQKFFTNNKPSGAEVIHQGASGGGANYVIYKLTTDSGSYRVQIFMKNSGTGKIHEIKIKRS